MTEYTDSNTHSKSQIQYYDYLIVGTGLSGAVLAERLATINNNKILTK
jgi:choline dehydrogenase-like flavoprotein